MRRTEVIDTHCNICGEPLNEQDLQNEYAIQECLGYGSVHDEEEHRVKFCTKCFAELLNSCKLPTTVKKYIEPTGYRRGLNINPEEDPVPGEFCNLCGGIMTNYDLQEKIVIQAEHNNQKHRVQSCCACFDKIIEKCKHPSLIKDWG